MPEKESEILEKVKENIMEASKQLTYAVATICELMLNKGQLISGTSGTPEEEEDFLSEIRRLTDENE
ncbi:MAG: hypothetical protein II837_03320, partial [Treponema sp.]|nr:hypothetical protein [Treponema sp.]